MKIHLIMKYMRMITLLNMRKIAFVIYEFIFYDIPEFICCIVGQLLYKYTDNILVVSWVKPTIWGTIGKQNFGDDINKPLLERISGKRVLFTNQILSKDVPHIAAIGSIIGLFTNNKSIIWGTGFISEHTTLPEKPLKVCAVRGPLTRRVLLENNIDCPELYGDPALLLPYIYNPPVEKKYKLGIIPHYIDYNLSHVQKFKKEHPEVHVIKLNKYKNWKHVIDQIISCESIASSSLHGLIVSDAYGIPNVQLLLSSNIRGENFKFKDYMGGVGRTFRKPLNCKEHINMDDIANELKYYEPIHFNSKKLLDAFPFKLASDKL